jgi:hypothetical protein
MACHGRRAADAARTITRQAPPMNIGCQHAAHDQFRTPDPTITAPRLPRTQPDSNRQRKRR